MTGPISGGWPRIGQSLGDEDPLCLLGGGYPRRLVRLTAGLLLQPSDEHPDSVGQCAQPVVDFVDARWLRLGDEVRFQRACEFAAEQDAPQILRQQREDVVELSRGDKPASVSVTAPASAAASSRETPASWANWARNEGTSCGDRDVGGNPALIEDATQQFGQLSAQVGRLVDTDAVTDRVQPGAQRTGVRMPGPRWRVRQQWHAATRVV